jgi:hypothetical protein
MTGDSTPTVSQAQANLPKLIRQDSFAIARHGKLVGVCLSLNHAPIQVDLWAKKLILAGIWACGW